MFEMEFEFSQKFINETKYIMFSSPVTLRPYETLYATDLVNWHLSKEMKKHLRKKVYKIPEI